MPNPLDFKKVEALRSHMLIPTTDWVGMLGVSRMTYYKWVNGKSQPRPNKLADVRSRVKVLLAAVAKGWPEPDIKGLEPKDRVGRLLAFLKQPE